MQAEREALRDLSGRHYVLPMGWLLRCHDPRAGGSWPALEDDHLNSVYIIPLGARNVYCLVMVLHTVLGRGCVSLPTLRDPVAREGVKSARKWCGDPVGCASRRRDDCNIGDEGSGVVSIG